MKVNINGHGHMTKIATMAINSKNLEKFYSSEPEAYDFETMPEASVNGALQSLYNDDSWDNLDLFYGKASLGRLLGEHLQDHWSSGNVLGWDEILVKLLSEYVSQPL